MHITDEDIAEFRRLWREEYGEELSEDDARIKVRRFLGAFVLLAGPGRKRPDPEHR